MRLIPAIVWRPAAPGQELDPRLVPLLEAIAASGSLTGAVVACGMSYRAAWGLLRDHDARLGVGLVDLERGRGARLAPAGEKLLAAHRAATQRLARTPMLAVELGSRPADPRSPDRVNVAASHDLALAALRDALPAAAGVSLDLAFMGSLHALEQFDSGRADVAGFHVPLGAAFRGGLEAFRGLLRDKRDRMIRFVDREQGFMLARGNPARARTFRDLVRKGLRFVNRQRGSGTRLLIDRLVADEGLDGDSLVGYGHEEFTHAAVAATVASGAADAGFGLRAAAAEYRLAFVPRARERYYLAVRASMVATPAIRRLIEALQSPLLARAVGTLRGYRLDGAGQVIRIDALGR